MSLEDNISMTVQHASLESEQHQLEAVLSTIDKDTKADVEEKLKNPGSGRIMFERMFDQDEHRSHNRSQIQAMKDYKRPYDQAKLQARGRGGQFNVNFGEGASVINEAVNGYVDIFTSTETLLSIPLKHGYMDEGDALIAEAIMSQELSKMIRAWDQGLFNYLELVDEFVTHGLSISSFADMKSWHFESSDLSKWKFPPRTKAVSSAVPACAASDMYSPSHMMDFIRNEKVAADMGWNVDAVKNTILSAERRDGSGEGHYDLDNPQDLEEMVKAQDDQEAGIFKPIEVIKMLVRENSGKVSYYIFTRNPIKNADPDGELGYVDTFLFRKHEAYESMSQALSIFPFFTGTNGNIHTIRGLGHMIYPQVQASNLMQCAMLDSARDAMSTKYITPQESELETIPIVQAGPATLIPNSLQIADKQHTPDLQRSAVPAMNLLNQQIQKMSVTSSLSNVFNSGQDRRSTFEVGAAIEFFSSINASAMRLFAKPWRELLVEVARRAFAPNQDLQTEAGRAAKRMQERCIRRGLNEDMFKHIDYIEALVKMPVGLGSKSARNSIYQQGLAMMPDMDEVGRQRFVRSRAVDLFGPEEAGQYFNFESLERPLVDDKLAELENNQLIDGKPVSPSPSENFIVHLRRHIPFMWDFVRQHEEGLMELTDVTRAITPLWEHSLATLEIAIVPQVNQEEINAMKQSLQQIGEIVSNGQKAIQKEAREAQAAPQQGGISPEEQLKLQQKQAEHQQKLIHKQQDHELAQAIKQQEFQQEQLEWQMEQSQKAAEEARKAAPIIRANPTNRP